MGGVKEMSSRMDDHQLETQWHRVCSRLKSEIGDSAFDNWLKPLKVAQLEGSEVHLAVPSRFMRDWILANYLDRLKELWHGENAGVQSVALSIQPASAAPDQGKVAKARVLAKPGPKAVPTATPGAWQSNGNIAAPLDPNSRSTSLWLASLMSLHTPQLAG